MKCYYHNEKDGVSQCSSCGIFLCRECSDQYELNGKVICEKCAKKVESSISEEKRNVKKDLGIIAFLWISLIIGKYLDHIGYLGSDGDLLLGLILFTGVIILRRLIPMPNVFLTGGGWFWFIILCLYLSWGIFYLLFIYPLRQYKIILSLFK